MTPFQIAAVAYAERGVTTAQLRKDRVKDVGGIGDLVTLARAAHR